MAETELVAILIRFTSDLVERLMPNFRLWYVLSERRDRSGQK